MPSVKPLTFKGDKKPKKRKRVADSADVQTSASKEVATTEEAPSDDSWVTADQGSDIAGPVLIVLPSEPGSCLACDANGKVFASPIENFVDDDPRTAEPHDVRQVWVVNRVAGTEDISFKGHHGKYGSKARNTWYIVFNPLTTDDSYLSCDKFGILSASATAISPEESFLCIAVPDNPSTFSMQTKRDKFLAISDSNTSAPDVRGDSEEITFNTTFHIRMQARFKPRLKASKQEKATQKISRKELEEGVGRRLNDDEVKRLKRARREGNYHEELLNIKVKGKHDKFA